LKESEKARNVRLLLAKHQEQVNQLLQLRAAQEINATMNSHKDEIPVRENSGKGITQKTTYSDCKIPNSDDVSCSQIR
jgi:hypothetical protein